METTGAITLATDMHCEKCVSKVKPALEAIGNFKKLEFDMDSPQKTIRFVGDRSQQDQIIATLKSLNYHAWPLETPPAVGMLETYKPLLLIALFLVGVTGLIEVKAGSFDSLRAMNDFMGGFFIFFSFFKLLNLTGFAEAFSTYDLIAKKTKAYGFLYPFLELVLGIGFVLGLFPVAVNVATILLMIIGNIGVWTVLRQKKTIQCACLGTVFNLPMTKVTLFENTLMLAMALYRLFA